MSSPYDSPQHGYQPQPYPDQGYRPPAGHPAWDVQQPAAAAAPRRPGVLIAAGVLWLLNGVFLTFLGVLTAIADRFPGFDEAMRRQGSDIDPQLLRVLGIGGAVLGLAVVGLAVVLLRGGALWARVLIILVALLPSLILAGLVLFPLFTLVAGVLQFLPPVGRYLRVRTGRPLLR